MTAPNSPDRSTPAGAGLEEPDPSGFLSQHLNPPEGDSDTGEDPDGDDGEPQLTREQELELENLRLKARLEGRDEALDALIENRGEPRAPAPPLRPDPPPPEPGQMPDPAQDPEGFRTWHAADVRRRDWEHNQRISQLRAEGERRSLGTQLWNDFQRLYPDKAYDEDFVAAMFQVVTGGQLPADSRGQSRMLKNIADRIPARSTQDADQAGGKNPGEEPGKSGGNRTGGLSAGSRNRQKKGGKDDGTKIKTLRESIGDRQVGSAFF